MNKETYNLLLDFRAMERARRSMIEACLEAMVAEVRFTYTDLFVG